jgi:hypothetical protein
MGMPRILAIGFPGKRDEAMRAGMMAMMLFSIYRPFELYIEDTDSLLLTY